MVITKIIIMKKKMQLLILPLLLLQLIKKKIIAVQITKIENVNLIIIIKNSLCVYVIYLIFYLIFYFEERQEE